MSVEGDVVRIFPHRSEHCFDLPSTDPVRCYAKFSPMKNCHPTLTLQRSLLVV